MSAIRKQVKPLVYPVDFIQAVKDEFPDWKELHQSLNSNGVIVGRYLDDSQQGGGITSEELIEALDAGGTGTDAMSKLRQKAEQHIRRQKLYVWWSKLCHDCLEE
ncbi:hypothetical protein A3K24_02265 [candidate division Kazan bacterium RIFCSPHIGHO2_01_FULL_44_14]|uniref:Uncharacterized protein n=1 Tax=candidate division Kazan bacterium RIFCSPLOWO2_01_FULL_45_19 TaxID=1798538 RepID=A0A1F4NQB1_UNCK3|nr:hypothetical protein [uncultured bacterium]AQS31066.1 hypothetical protein [uncultured bacterium]OGB73644.1 MAG: hypothetical protein A3K51_02265 [candidate division Kazan bacterium RIFCSPLOWO2_01_FULL_45_19]OGB77889.1 MAG: hypothetical protein A3K24_02265 [candidate division Kazan bacterium RIFCSPHIGHO2_01_FULL_44_14]